MIVSHHTARSFFPSEFSRFRGQFVKLEIEITIFFDYGLTGSNLFVLKCSGVRLYDGSNKGRQTKANEGKRRQTKANEGKRRQTTLRLFVFGLRQPFATEIYLT